MKKYFIILLSLFLFNCVSRKVENNKSVVKETLKTDSLVKIIELIKENVYVKKDIEKNEFNYEPIDPKSEFIIDGKVYKNVQINHKKTIDKTKFEETKTLIKNKDITVKKAFNKQSNVAIKISNKKGLHILSKIGIIIISISIIVGSGYLYINK
jgi:hypothetical protein